MSLLNLHQRKRLFRLLIGGALLATGWWGLEVGIPDWAVSLRVVALYPLLTGLAGWCPAVSLMSTRGIFKSRFDDPD